MAEIRSQLVPNFHNLDSQVQHELNNTLSKIYAHSKSKHELGDISRKVILDEAPLLRSHLWKCNPNLMLVLLGVYDGDWQKWPQLRKKN